MAPKQINTKQLTMKTDFLPLGQLLATETRSRGVFVPILLLCLRTLFQKISPRLCASVAIYFVFLQQWQERLQNLREAII